MLLIYTLCALPKWLVAKEALCHPLKARKGIPLPLQYYFENNQAIPLALSQCNKNPRNAIIYLRARECVYQQLLQAGLEIDRHVFCLFVKKNTCFYSKVFPLMCTSKNCGLKIYIHQEIDSHEYCIFQDKFVHV